MDGMIAYLWRSQPVLGLYTIGQIRQAHRSMDLS